MGVEPTSLAWKASIISRYTTAAILFINEQWAGGPLHITNSGS